MAKGTCRSQQNAVIMALIAMKTEENVLASISYLRSLGEKFCEIARLNVCI